MLLRKEDIFEEDEIMDDPICIGMYTKRIGQKINKFFICSFYKCFSDANANAEIE